jgi:hypothetical protein
MGSAISTLYNSIDGVTQNPASLSEAPNYVHANFTDFVLGINTSSLGAGMDFKGYKYAVNFRYMNFGDFDKYDEDGIDLGSFSAGDKEFSLSVAKKLGNYFSAGITTAYLNSNIDHYSASALKMDFGLQYYLPSQNLSLGISFKNFDTMLSNYSTKKEHLENLLLFGISKKLQYAPAIIAVDILKYETLDVIANLGVRIVPSNHFRFYIGASSRKIELQNHRDLKSLIAGISGGCGFSVKSWNFDIGYSSLGDAGNITSFSFYKLLN